MEYYHLSFLLCSSVKFYTFSHIYFIGFAEYFIVSVAIVNSNYFSIRLSNWLLLVNRKAVGFCLMTLNLTRSVLIA